MPLTIVVPHNLRIPEYRMIESLSDPLTVRAIVVSRLVAAGNGQDVIDSFTEQYDKGDYMHGLRVIMAFTAEPDDDYGFEDPGEESYIAP